MYRLTIRSTTLTLLLVSFCIVMLLSNTGLGEEQNKVHSLYKGALALQFQSSVSSRVIAGKYHLKDEKAFQVRFGLNGRSGWDDRYNDYGSDLYLSEEIKNYNYRASLDLLYLTYKKPFSTLNTFWGLGPATGFSYSWRESSSIPGDYPNHDYTTENTSKVTSWDFGLIGSIGFEWFIKPKFSLIADYRVNAYYSGAEVKNKTIRIENGSRETTNYSETKSGDINFNYDRMDIGISFYF